jgi:hypothetical protein
LEYPQLAGSLPQREPLPDDYERLFPAIGVAHIRRGSRDGTIVLANNSSFFSMRKGSAVVQAVRFAASFFGKGQFVPQAGDKQGAGYSLRQTLEAPYYQPLDPPQEVTPANWSSLMPRRRRTQICRLEQTATIHETRNGFELRVQARGTKGVPLALEISLREGGQLEGCRAAPGTANAMLLEKDYAVYRVGGDMIRFGPGTATHYETRLRGAEAQLPGTSVYLTGYTPFEHAIRFEV